LPAKKNNNKVTWQERWWRAKLSIVLFKFWNIRVFFLEFEFKFLLSDPNFLFWKHYRNLYLLKIHLFAVGNSFHCRADSWDSLLLESFNLICYHFGRSSFHYDFITFFCAIILSIFFWFFDFILPSISPSLLYHILSLSTNWIIFLVLERIWNSALKREGERITKTDIPTGVGIELDRWRKEERNMSREEWGRKRAIERSEKKAKE